MSAYGGACDDCRDDSMLSPRQRFFFSHGARPAAHCSGPVVLLSCCLPPSLPPSLAPSLPVGNDNPLGVRGSVFKVSVANESPFESVMGRLRSLDRSFKKMCRKRQPSVCAAGRSRHSRPKRPQNSRRKRQHARKRPRILMWFKTLQSTWKNKFRALVNIARYVEREFRALENDF